MVTLAIIAICAILTFAPVEFGPPGAGRRARPLTLAMTAPVVGACNHRARSSISIRPCR